MLAPPEQEWPQLQWEQDILAGTCVSRSDPHDSERGLRAHVSGG